MEQNIFNNRLSWLLLFVMISFLGSVDAYKNYTVGDSLGWFDNLEKPHVNYDKWVANKNFSLGDFLIFNTDNNHSVVQTYNFTTYNKCDYDNALDNDTSQWSSTDPSSTSIYPVSIAVHLLKVGATYFFSSDYDGEQCKNGQQFKINVTYGQGLPRSHPSSDDSLAPISPISGDEESAPDTIVPASFDHPHEVSSDDSPEPSSSVSLSIFSKFLGTYSRCSFECAQGKPRTDAIACKPRQPVKLPLASQVRQTPLKRRRQARRYPGVSNL